MTNVKEQVQGETAHPDSPHPADDLLSAQKGYIVGYAKPPKHSQFQKGKSGNPKGRPKGSKSLNSVLQEEFDQQVSMARHGKKIKVPVIRAMAATVWALALKGHPAFMKLAFQLYATSHPASNDNDLDDAGSSFELTPEDWAAIEKSNLLKKSK